MIPTLTIMVGFYIVARMVDQIAIRSDSRVARGLSITCAIIAIGIAAIGMITVAMQSAKTEAAMRDALRTAPADTGDAELRRLLDKIY